MSFIPIRKIQKRHPETNAVQEFFAVPAVGIATPQGKKLLPNPSGNEACLYASLAEAEEAIRMAGFDYEYEGRKTYTLGQPSTTSRKQSAVSASSPMERAIPLLIQHLRDREATVVANAAYALGTLRAFAALEPLIENLGHDDPTVRKNVAETLARLCPSALSSLREAFEKARASHHKNAPYIRLSIMTTFLEVVEHGGGSGIAMIDQYLPLAVAALEDESWLVRAQAALVVGRTAQALEEERRKAERQR